MIVSEHWWFEKDQALIARRLFRGSKDIATEGTTKSIDLLEKFFPTWDTDKIGLGRCHCFQFEYKPKDVRQTKSAIVDISGCPRTRDDNLLRLVWLKTFRLEKDP